MDGHCVVGMGNWAQSVAIPHTALDNRVDVATFVVMKISADALTFARSCTQNSKSFSGDMLQISQRGLRVSSPNCFVQT